MLDRRRARARLNGLFVGSRLRAPALDRSRSHGRPERAGALRSHRAWTDPDASRRRMRPGRSCRSAAACAPVNVLMNLGDADYDGLQTQISYRGHARWYAAVSYTLSQGDQHQRARRQRHRTQRRRTSRGSAEETERGPSLLDQRHRAVITFSYQLPYNVTAGTVTQLRLGASVQRRDRPRQQRRRANNDRPVVDGRSVLAARPSAVPGPRTCRSSSRGGSSAPAGPSCSARRLQPVQPRQHPRPRADDLRRHRHGQPDLRSGGRRRHGHQRAAGAGEHRPAAHVPAPDAVSVLRRAGRHAARKRSDGSQAGQEVRWSLWKKIEFLLIPFVSC